MSGPCLSCSTARNGSLSPNTLDLNAFVAVAKELPIGLNLLFFLNTILAPEHFLLIPCTHDKNTHLSIRFHLPLSSSPNFFVLTPAYNHTISMDSLQQEWATFSIKSQGVNILAAATIHLGLLHPESCHMIHKQKLWPWSKKTLFSPNRQQVSFGLWTSLSIQPYNIKTNTHSHFLLCFLAFFWEWAGTLSFGSQCRNEACWWPKKNNSEN